MKHLTVITTLVAALLIAAAVPTATARDYGEFKTLRYLVSDFSGIDADGDVKIVYTVGDEYHVTITARSDFHQYLEVKKVGSVLHLHTKDGLPDNVKSKDRTSGGNIFVCHITAPRMNTLNVRGMAELEAARVVADEMKVNVQGLSKLRISHLTADAANLSVQGVSELRLPDVNVQGNIKVSAQGVTKYDIKVARVNDLDVKMQGASEGKLSFKGNMLQISCKGVSELDASVECNRLKVGCKGAAEVRLDGTADNVEIDRSSVVSQIDTHRLNQY